MKTRNYIYLLALWMGLLSEGNMLRASSPPEDSTQKVKSALLSDEFAPSALIGRTDDTNRLEVITALKNILGECLANPTTGHNPLIAGSALKAYAVLNKGNDTFATLQPFLNYPDPAVQKLAIRYIAKSGDPSAFDALKSKLQTEEASLPAKDDFTAKTEKQYLPAFQAYLQILIAMDRIKTPEAVQFRDQSLARFKAKYDGTDFGPKFIDAYNEGLKRESQK